MNCSNWNVIPGESFTLVSLWHISTYNFRAQRDSFKLNAIKSMCVYGVCNQLSHVNLNRVNYREGTKVGTSEWPPPPLPPLTHLGHENEFVHFNDWTIYGWPFSGFRVESMGEHTHTEAPLTLHVKSIRNVYETIFARPYTYTPTGRGKCQQWGLIII